MKIALLCLVLCIQMHLYAATTGNIVGIVLDAQTKTPLDYVTVSVTARASKSIVGSAATSVDGYFSIKSLSFGQYSIRLTYIGYEPFELPFQLTKNNPNFNIGEVLLSEASRELAELQVLGQKSSMRLELDKKVFDVAQSATLAGSAATDVLRIIPSVEVDTEGNVSLRNNSNVTIWLNGRPSGLTADNQAQILEQLPSESIERIEIITNPSSKYSASGTAGIINIVLRKDRRLGYYGSVNATADTFGGYNVGGNINISDKKYDAYFNIGYRDRKFIMERNSLRSFGEGADFDELTTHSVANRFGGGFFARTGFSYRFSEKDLVGISGMVMDGDRNNDDEVSYSYLNRPEQNRLRQGRNRGDLLIYNLMLDYQKKFDNPNDELRASVSFSSHDMPSDNIYSTLSLPNNAIVSNQSQNRLSSRMEIEPQIDYTKKFSDFFRLETGYKGGFEGRSSTTKTYTFDTPDFHLWNKFENLEISNSLYASGAGKYKKFTYMAGLRGEWYFLDNFDTRYSDATTSEMFNYNEPYFGVFPTVSLTYSFAEGNDMQVNYSRRINRPRGRQLRPMPDIADSLNISIGNPNLQPDFSNAFELNYLRAWDSHSLSGTLYLRSTENGIFNVEYMDKGIKYTTYANIINSSNVGVEMVIKNRFFKVLDLTTTLNMYYNSINAINYEPIPSVFSQYAASNEFQWSARIIAQTILPYMWSIQLVGSYNSPITMPQGHSEQSYGVDVGVRKSFFGKKLNVSLSGRDLLDSRRLRLTTYGAGYRESMEAKYGGRMLSLTLTYSFGVNNQKHNKRQSSSPNMEEGGDYGSDY